MPDKYCLLRWYPFYHDKSIARELEGTWGRLGKAEKELGKYMKKS
jgi:hypothetical protein